MAVNCLISSIENKRQLKMQKTENYVVHISNHLIFQDLEYVFMHIDGYKKLYIKIFEDMSHFEFTKCSSVTDMNDNMISELGVVFLYQHTVNTFKQMVAIVDSNNDYKVQCDLYFLIALLHDVGKSHELCEYYKIALYEKHHIRSAQYFKKIIDNDTEEYFGIDAASFNIIYETLKNHHDEFAQDSLNSKFLFALKKADSSARDYEKEQISRSA